MKRKERMIGSAILAAAFMLSLTTSRLALAADEQNVTSGFTAAGAPLALHGYDPVAFFTRGGPEVGSAQYATVHDGATYYFTSKEHQRAFVKKPAKYVPAFGGYCAFGVSVGKKFDGNPRYWTVSGERLYLNLNADIAKQFRKDVPGAIAKAEKNWREIEHRSVGEL